MPFILHVTLLPAAHKACGTIIGGANGPVMIANECKISAMLRPKMMRWYGEVQSVDVSDVLVIVLPLMMIFSRSVDLERATVIATIEEAMKEILLEDIWHIAEPTHILSEGSDAIIC